MIGRCNNQTVLSMVHYLATWMHLSTCAPTCRLINNLCSVYCHLDFYFLSIVSSPFEQPTSQCSVVKRSKVKRYSSPKQVISELRGVTCHMGSQSVTCHPTQVNSPHLTPSRQAGWYSIYLPWRYRRLS